MPPVAQNAELEKEEGGGERRDQRSENRAHGQVALGARYVRFGFFLARKLADGEPHRLFDDAALTDDADKPGHGDSADTQRTTEGLVQLFGGHACARGGRTDHRNDEQPDQERTGGDDGRIFQSDDVTQAEHRSTRIDFEQGFELIGAEGAPSRHAGRDLFRPEAEGTRCEVVQTAHQSGYGQQLGLIAAFFARYEHFGRGRRLREGVLAVHLLDEIFAEGDEQHDAQDTAQYRREEYFVECGFQTEDVERRQGEDRSGDDDARRGADRLYDDVLSQHVFFAQHVSDAYGDDGDRDGRFEYLADAQAQIGCGGGEENGHQQAHRDRIGCDLLRLGVGRHHRDVLFARFEFAVRVVGQRLRGFGLFHCVCRFSLKFRGNLQK